MSELATVGQYRIVRRIGVGGMGAVYLAEHVLIGRRAAIKILHGEFSQRRDIVERFFNEARATTSIVDAGIVQVFDFGYHTDGTAYIVMEFLEGESLEQRLDRIGRLRPTDALRITRQVAGSLAAAHARGIVHRDLKPDNLFMVADSEARSGERAKVLDFGIAKLTVEQPGRSKTSTGVMMGTPTYMSPEQCRGAGAIDYRSDIYSLGCVLHHLVAGRPPFEAEGMGELIAAHLHIAPRPPSALTGDTPKPVDDVVMRCLAKSPGDRYQTMTELQQACDHALARITAVDTAAPTVAMNAAPQMPGFRSDPGSGPVLMSPPNVPLAPTEYGTMPPPSAQRGSANLLPTAFPNPSQPAGYGAAPSHPKPTTLGASSGESIAPTSPRGRGVWIGLGAGVAAITAVATIGAMGLGHPHGSGSGTGDRATSAASAPTAVIDGGVAAASTPAAPTPAAPPAQPAIVDGGSTVAQAPVGAPPAQAIASPADAAVAIAAPAKPAIQVLVQSPPTTQRKPKQPPTPHPPTTSGKPPVANDSNKGLYDDR